jgi:hypothetical protein
MRDDEPRPVWMSLLIKHVRAPLLAQRGCGGRLTPVRAAGRYAGAFQNDDPHGHGTLTFANGDRCAHPAWPRPAATGGPPTEHYSTLTN